MSSDTRCVIISKFVHEDWDGIEHYQILLSEGIFLPFFDDVKDLFPEAEKITWNDGESSLWVYVIPGLVDFCHLVMDLPEGIFWCTLDELGSDDVSRKDMSMAYNGLIRDPKYSNITSVLKTILDKEEDNEI